MKRYVKNYIESIELGLRSTQYKVKGIEKEAEFFFEELNSKTKEIKSNNGRLLYFGNGDSAAFSNHMALD